MNIIFFLSNLNGGGAERSTVELANHLAYKNINVTLFVKESGVYKNEINKKVKLIIGQSNNISHLFTAFKFFRNIRGNTIYIGIMPTQTLYAYILSLITKAKVIGYERNNVFESSKIYKWYKIKYLLLLRLIYLRVNFVFGLSKGVVLDLVNNGYALVSKSDYLYNTINIKEINILANCENEIIIDPYIVCVGRLTKMKGVFDLLLAFSFMKNKNLKLVYIGQGEAIQELIKMCKDLKIYDRVIFKGFQVNPFPYIKNSRLLVFPSHSEGFGNVLTQALALNSNIVSTDCKSGPSEILKKGLYGRLVEVGKPKSLCKAMEKAILEPITYNNIAALQEFDVDKITNKFIKICNNL